MIAGLPLLTVAPVKTDVATPMATVALLRHQSITCQMTRVTFVETISIVSVAMINKHNMVAMIDKHNTVAMINKHTAMAPICKHNRHHRIF